VNLEKNKLYGMKSHDRHMYIQTLIPITFRDLFPKKTWNALTKINYFFQDICLNKLNTQHLKQLVININETICKFEMIFLFFFFDSMEYLPIHLTYEKNIRRSCVIWLDVSIQNIRDDIVSNYPLFFFNIQLFIFNYFHANTYSTLRKMLKTKLMLIL